MAKDPAKNDTDEPAETLPHIDAGARSPVFFSAPSVNEAAVPTDADPQLGVLGDYELIGELGEGGMGIVYRARQKSANRTVALKVIRPERLSALTPSKKKEAVERFQTEAQAAAQLDHDNIVTVYDVGEVNGQQYFSMRYVDGESLADLLREGPLQNHDAASYIEPVARAVHEAHQNGVLHRDLKPQNILIDGKSDRALVADFGLAKLTEQDDELTRAGDVMGTPQYMSPEQARDSAHVTERSDVYSLGATLYHLLTGRPVFQAATPLETLRQVIDEIPVPPRRLNPAIDRDLETICVRCLEKEPNQRYQSACELADELKRYLNGEPIQARPISGLGRLWRWSLRNRLVASLAGTALLCLISLLIVVTVAYFQTAAAHRRSEEFFLRSLDVVNVFFTRVSEETLLDQPGLHPLRKDLLSQARDYYAEFLEQRSSDDTIQDRLAETHFRVGLVTAEIDSPKKALRSYEKALHIQRKLVARESREVSYLVALANTLNANGEALFKLDRLSESLTVFEEARMLRAQLAQIDAEHVDYQRKLANVHMNKGAVLKQQGDLQDARQEFEKAQEIRGQLIEREPNNARLLRDLAKGSFHLGDLLSLAGDAAFEDESNEKAAQLFKDAADQFESATDTLTELFELERTIEDQYLVTLCYFSLARVQPDDGQEDAIAYYRRALSGIEKLETENPKVDKFRSQHAGILIELANSEFQMQNVTSAESSLNTASVLLRKLVREDPDTTTYHEDLVRTVEMQAFLSGPEEEFSIRLRDLLAKLVDEFPKVEYFSTLKSELDQEIDGALKSNN